MRLFNRSEGHTPTGYLTRLRAMLGLGVSTYQLAEKTRERQVQIEDAARRERLGDVTGQAARATAFSQKVDAKTLTFQ